MWCMFLLSHWSAGKPEAWISYALLNYDPDFKTTLSYRKDGHVNVSVFPACAQSELLSEDKKVNRCGNQVTCLHEAYTGGFWCLTGSGFVDASCYAVRLTLRKHWVMCQPWAAVCVDAGLKLAHTNMVSLYFSDHQKLEREARICRLLKHSNIGE